MQMLVYLTPDLFQGGIYAGLSYSSQYVYVAKFCFRPYIQHYRFQTSNV